MTGLGPPRAPRAGGGGREARRPALALSHPAACAGALGASLRVGLYEDQVPRRRGQSGCAGAHPAPGFQPGQNGAPYPEPQQCPRLSMATGSFWKVPLIEVKEVMW